MPPLAKDGLVKTRFVSERRPHPASKSGLRQTLERDRPQQIEEKRRARRPRSDVILDGHSGKSLAVIRALG
jgi:hypothetical protein